MRFKLIEGTQISTLKLSILDETESKPELIGDTVIQLAPVYQTLPTEGYDKWHELTYKGKYAGEVYLEMTFYPEKKPTGRKFKRSSIMESSVNRSGTCSTTRSDTTSYYDYTGSLNFSSSMVSMASSRPLPSQPLPATASTAALHSSTAQTLTSSLATVRAPLNTQQLHSFSMFPGVPKVDPALDPSNLSGTHSAHNCGSHHSNSFNMSAMSHSLPNPLDFQIACEIDLPAIPPETTLGQDHTVSEQHKYEENAFEYQFDNSFDNGKYTKDPENEFHKFFNTPIPDVPESHIQRSSNETYTAKPLPEPNYHQSTQVYSSTSLNSSLNRSTGSQKSTGSTNNFSSNSNTDLGTSLVSKGLPVMPRPESKGFSCSEENLDSCPTISNKMSIRRKPISLKSSPAKETPVLPYPGATHSVSDIGAEGHSINDDEDIKEIPFSPDSYVLRKSLPQPPLHAHLRINEAPPSPPKEKNFKSLQPLNEHMPVLNLTESLTLEPQLRPMKPLPPSPPAKEHDERIREISQDSYSDYNNGFSQYQHDDSYSPVELQNFDSSYFSLSKQNLEHDFENTAISNKNVFGQIGALGKRYYKPQPPIPTQEPQSEFTYPTMSMSLSSMSGSVLRTSPMPRVRGGRDSPSNFTESFSGKFSS